MANNEESIGTIDYPTVGEVSCKPMSLKPCGLYVRGGTNKSLARPGRKQSTATKLGIYSPYGPTTLNTLLSPLL